MAQKRMNKRQQRLERQRRIKKKRRKRLAIILIEIVILAGLGVVAYGMFVMDKMDTTTLNKDKLEVYKDTGDYTNIALFVWIPEKVNWMEEYRAIALWLQALTIRRMK